MNKIILINLSLVLALVAFIAFNTSYIATHSAKPSTRAGAIDTNVFMSGGTFSSSSISNVDTIVVATNTARNFLEIDVNGAIPAFCSFGVPAVLNRGFRLDTIGLTTSTGQGLVASNINLDLRALHCIASATTTVNVVEESQTSQ